MATCKQCGRDVDENLLAATGLCPACENVPPRNNANMPFWLLLGFVPAALFVVWPAMAELFFSDGFNFLILLMGLTAAATPVYLVYWAARWQRELHGPANDKMGRGILVVAIAAGMTIANAVAAGAGCATVMSVLV